MDVEKEFIPSLLMIIFVIILLFFYIFNYNRQPPILTTPSATRSVDLTSTELAKHNTTDDCWIVIDSKVLKITPYLNFHPGGADIIAQYCGQDATDAFNSKGGRGRGHSSYAVSLLERFVIGIIGQNVNYSVINQTGNTNGL